MVALGNGFVDRGLCFDVIAVEHRHLIEMTRENASGHQSRDAAADNYSVLTQTIGHEASPCSTSILGADEPKQSTPN
jgi:hypothetical protein